MHPHAHTRTHTHARTHTHTHTHLYCRHKNLGSNKCMWPPVIFRLHTVHHQENSALLYHTSYLHYRDGVISKEEMTQYFLGAYQSLKRIFKHNFQECSYNIITPTYCDHCKGRLIGYVKQGYKCKGLWYLNWCLRIDGLIYYIIFL